MSKTKKILIGIILLTVVLLGIGYAAIQNVTLNIAGTATADPSQANFIVRFTGIPEVSEPSKVTASITNDTNATINVDGLTSSGESVTATYTVENASSDLSADLLVETTNSNEEYFSIEAKLDKTSLVAGETTTLTVNVGLLKTPISGEEIATIGIVLTATPVQPGKEGTTNGSGNENEGGSGNASGLNEYGFYYGVPYSVVDGEDKLSFVAFEDGSGFIYLNEVKANSIPEGTFVYAEKSITLDGEIVEVSEDGTQLSNEEITLVAELGVTIERCGVWGHTSDDGLEHSLAEDCHKGHYICEGVCTGACTVACGIEGHSTNDGLDHTIVAGCPARHFACQDACMEWQVPADGTYTMVSAVNGTKTVYNEGELLPECYQSRYGDIFTCGDYEYKYKQDYNPYYDNWQEGYGSFWGVKVIDLTKTEYGDFCLDINGESNLSLVGTFTDCELMTKSPEIPEGITSLWGTFWGCTKLETAPVIPDTVRTLGRAFQDCSSLTAAPIIPNDVTAINSMFEGCTNLKTYIGSTDEEGDFSGYIIPQGVTTLLQTFWDCINMIIPPVIPESVTDMYGTFANCTSLTVAPIIPEKVTDVTGLFNACHKLKTYVGSTDADGDFSNYVIPEGVTDMRWTFFECSLLTNAPVIPSSVTRMYRTFCNCTLLTGTIQVNTDQITTTNSDSKVENNGGGCFTGTTKPIILKGTGNNQTTLQILAGTANSGNVTIE